MPANTPKGYPYPLGTDRLMDGDDSIHNLATAVDTKLGTAATGTTTVPVVTAGVNYTVSVTFPAGRFVNAPTVVVCAQTSNPTTCMASMNTGTTTTGFTFVGQRVSGGSNPFTVYWHAIDAA